MSFIVGFSPNAELTQNSPNTELIPQTLHKNVLPANARLNLFTLVFKTYNIFYYTFYFEKYLTNIRPCCVYRIQTEFYLFCLGSAQFCS